MRPGCCRTRSTTGWLGRGSPGRPAALEVLDLVRDLVGRRVGGACALRLRLWWCFVLFSWGVVGLSVRALPPRISDWGVKVPAYRHSLGTLLGCSVWYDANICSVHRRGRLIRRVSVAREARRRELAEIYAVDAPQQAALDGDRARGRRRRRLARCWLYDERAVVGADLLQRPPQRRPHHAHKRRAAQAAGARRGHEQRRADARPGRRRRRGRDARDRRRARAHRDRQVAARDRTRRTHARAAGRRRRPGAVSAPRAAHDLDGGGARTQVQRLAAARTGRGVRAGDLEHRQTATRTPTRRAAARCSSGSSTPPMRSSRSPPSPAAKTAV